MTFFIDSTDSRCLLAEKLLSKEKNWRHKKTEDIAQANLLIFAPNKKFTPEELSSIQENSILFCGNVDNSNFLKNKNITHFNFLEDEVFSIKNSILTAEGILEKIINLTSKSIFKQKILIMGSGRVGKATAMLFSKLNLDFSLSSTSETNHGLNYIFCKKNYLNNDFLLFLNDFDIIINTIPARILNSEQIKLIKKSCLFLEISSITTINESNFRYELCPALPLKFSSETAGEIMFESIKNRLNI